MFAFLDHLLLLLQTILGNTSIHLSNQFWFNWISMRPETWVQDCIFLLIFDVSYIFPRSDNRMTLRCLFHAHILMPNSMWSSIYLLRAWVSHDLFIWYNSCPNSFPKLFYNIFSKNYLIVWISKRINWKNNVKVYDLNVVVVYWLVFND